MARQGTLPKKLKKATSFKRSNEDGYAKRVAGKEKRSQAADVYEYAPEKVRRSKITMDLDRDEEADQGFPRGGEEDTKDIENMRARLVGEADDDAGIDSDDDEDIDSDAAFEESDEDRFAGFFSRKKTATKSTKKTPSVRFADVDLNEDDEDEDVSDVRSDMDEEDGEPDEFIDILDILDGRANPDLESDDETPEPREKGKPIPHAMESSGDNNSSEDEDDEEASDHDAFLPSDNDEASPDALEKLGSFISGLDTTSSKRKLALGGDDNTEGRPRKRRMIKERNEAGVENEFRAHASGGKLNLDDLLAPLSSQSSNLLSLKKSVKILTSASSSKAQTLAAPLPQRTQERLDREAAYEQTKEEVDKWKSTMKRIKEAEHLSFPLQAEPAGRVSNMELTAKFKPSTDMENAVDALLKSAKLREEDILHTEDTMLLRNNLSVEEVAERRGELRKMRELMHRAEAKAKRVAKIKSKTYRKIKRKEKERVEEKLNILPDDDNENTRLKRETDRARERATLRHKNTGKWAKQMKDKNGWEEDGRKEIEDMLDRGDNLKKKIAGKDSEDESDASDESDEDSSGEAWTIEKIKATAFDKLQGLDKTADDTATSGVFAMKFMKDAMARRQQDVDRGIDDFARELGGGNPEAGDTDGILDVSSGAVISRAGGRIQSHPGGPAKGHALKQTSNTSIIGDPDHEVSTSSNAAIIAPSLPVTADAHHAANTDEANPWLTPRDPHASTKVQRKKNEVVVDKGSHTVEKSKYKIKKQVKKTEAEMAKASDDALVEISSTNVLTLTSSETPAKIVTSETGDSDDDSEANSEMAAQESALQWKSKSRGNGVKAFEQQDLVSRAFAGDNVVRDFEDAKRREIASDAPREIDTTLPGWGSWGGTGLQQARPRPHLIKKVAGVDPTNRADFKKGHVIISEKRDKKAAKYLVKDLPYPYTSKAQFERTMEQPLGLEWNTRVGFQRGTLPKVVKKMGTVINPLEKLF